MSLAKPADGEMCEDSRALPERSLLSFRKEGRLCVLDFGSFS